MKSTILIALGSLNLVAIGAMYAPQHEMTQNMLQSQGYSQVQTSFHIPLPFDGQGCGPGSNGVMRTHFNAIDARGQRQEGVVCYDRMYKTGIADINAGGRTTVVRLPRATG